MQLISDLVGLLFRGVMKLALLLVVAAFVFVVVFLGLLTALYMVARFLLTGRKPTFVTTFSRFRQTAQDYQRGHWPGNTAPSTRDAADVVDVESREVRSALASPSASQTRTD
jgi:hypothetical protein